MFRSFFSTLAVVLAAAVAVPTALAVDVHVRVEGQGTTIYGSTQPLIATGSTPLDALESASQVGEFYYHVKASSFGNYVDQIGRIPAGGSSGWVFKVNGASPPVGAGAYELKPGDTVLWYFATFGDSGGPPTLALTGDGRNCYRVRQQDDAGKTTTAVGAVLHVDGRVVSTTKSGRGCVGAHRSFVRATLVGTIRSNAVR